MTEMTISTHATERFVERFAGNLSRALARKRLRALLRRARFIRVQPGQGRLYGLNEMRFLVCQGVLVTVYRPSAHRRASLPSGHASDLWCAAV